MSIKWGQVNFEGPYRLDSWKPPYRAGIYAIMMKPDPQNKPNTYKILYFGESENMSERGFYKNHHKYNCWLREAGSLRNLFIGYYLMPDSTLFQRKSLEQQLIDQYKPKCNE